MAWLQFYWILGLFISTINSVALAAPGLFPAAQALMRAIPVTSDTKTGDKTRQIPIETYNAPRLFRRTPLRKFGDSGSRRHGQNDPNQEHRRDDRRRLVENMNLGGGYGYPPPPLQPAAEIVRSGTTVPGSGRDHYAHPYGSGPSQPPGADIIRSGTTAPGSGRDRFAHPLGSSPFPHPGADIVRSGTTAPESGRDRHIPQLGSNTYSLPRADTFRSNTGHPGDAYGAYPPPPLPPIERSTSVHPDSSGRSALGPPIDYLGGSTNTRSRPSTQRVDPRKPSSPIARRTRQGLSSSHSSRNRDRASSGSGYDPVQDALRELALESPTYYAPPRRQSERESRTSGITDEDIERSRRESRTYGSSQQRPRDPPVPEGRPRARNPPAEAAQTSVQPFRPPPLPLRVRGHYDGMMDVATERMSIYQEVVQPHRDTLARLYRQNEIKSMDQIREIANSLYYRLYLDNTVVQASHYMFEGPESLYRMVDSPVPPGQSPLTPSGQIILTGLNGGRPSRPDNRWMNYAVAHQAKMVYRGRDVELELEQGVMLSACISRMESVFLVTTIDKTSDPNLFGKVDGRELTISQGIGEILKREAFNAAVAWARPETASYEVYVAKANEINKFVVEHFTYDRTTVRILDKWSQLQTRAEADPMGWGGLREDEIISAEIRRDDPYG